MISGWQGEAFNQAPNSKNEIHGDKIAKQYGFHGGLVPGVTISAYLIHPAVEAWGIKWLEQGFAHVRVGSPLYDEEIFTVDITQQTAIHYTGRLSRPDGTVSATAEVSLPETTPNPPARRFDKVAPKEQVGPAASFDTFRKMQQEGCFAYRYHWGSKHNMLTYVRDGEQMPGIYRDNAFANMSFILGISNWVLASNAYMNPWVHLETVSQNYKAIRNDSRIVAEMTVADFYEKKGHEFVDVDVALYDEMDDSCLSTIKLRAIYKLRGM